MSYRPGYFVWRDLSTSDVDGAKAFYGEVCGWKVDPNPSKSATDNDYHTWLNNGRPVGGLMASPNPGMPPMWSSYCSVNDVEVAKQNAEAHGGKCVWGPVTMDGVGQMAGFIDPQGAFVCAYRDHKGDPEPTKPTVGDFCWEQLTTTDVQAAIRYYGAVFGWTTTDMPGDGAMKVFANGPKPTEQVATVGPAPAGTPPSWLSFVVVPDLADANGRVTRNGGTVVMPDIVVPGQGSFSVCRDPQGAFFGLYVAAN